MENIRRELPDYQRGICTDVLAVIEYSLLTSLTNQNANDYGIFLGSNDYGI